MNNQLNPLSLPCLRGKMGDLYYYSVVMSFKDVAQRIKLPREIDEKYESEELKLGEWIQRKIEPTRIGEIVDYLAEQQQRFFNSIIVGVFDGSPSWQDISVKNPALAEPLTDETISYLNRTFGILTLSGEESLFAIDGQHRAMGIRAAVRQNTNLGADEVSVVFIAHNTDPDGVVRTRRLFSTLNRYAKPVGKSDIIALSEDDNCAIITRSLIDDFPLLAGKIIVNKTAAISPDDTTHFTNVLTLYDLVERITTDKKVYSFQVTGMPHKAFTNTRKSEQIISAEKRKVKTMLTNTLRAIPSFLQFLASDAIDRRAPNTSLIFRPIGQTILFDVMKVAEANRKTRRARSFFAQDTFKLDNPTWRTIFWDEETNNIRTDKPRVRYATLLILEHIGLTSPRTRKDREMFATFSIDSSTL